MNFFKNWVLKARKTLTGEEVSSRLKKAERALELQYLDRIQSQVTAEQVGAAAKLIESLGNVHEAAIQAGSLLIVKQTDSEDRARIFTRSLTYAELQMIDGDPSWLQRPKELLGHLAEGAEPSAELEVSGARHG